MLTQIRTFFFPQNLWLYFWVFFDNQKLCFFWNRIFLLFLLFLEMLTNRSLSIRLHICVNAISVHAASSMSKNKLIHWYLSILSYEWICVVTHVRLLCNLVDIEAAFSWFSKKVSVCFVFYTHIQLVCVLSNACFVYIFCCCLLCAYVCAYAIKSGSGWISGI